MNYCIFKVQTDIQDSKNWDSVKFEKTENLEFNPSYIDIVSVYRAVYNNNKLLNEKIVSFEDFINWLNKYDEKITRYVGWGCLTFDIPVLLYQCIKYGYKFNSKLFTLIKYRTNPIFDIQECLYNWGKKNSLLLTVSDFNIKYDKILEQKYEDVKDKNKLLLEKGRLIYKLYCKTKNYF